MIKERDPSMGNAAFDRFIPETKDLIMRMLTKLPQQRITPKEAVEHDFFRKLGFSLKKKEEQPQDAAGGLGVIEEAKASELDHIDEAVQGAEESPEHGGKLGIDDEKTPEMIADHAHRHKAAKDGDHIDRMRADNYLDDEERNRQSKLRQQKSFHFTAEEQRLIREDPVMLKLLQHMVTDGDGRRSLALPNQKSKPMPIDLTKLSERDRLKLHRKLVKAQAGIKDADSSSDVEMPEFMFPDAENYLENTQMAAGADFAGVLPMGRSASHNGEPKSGRATDDKA